MRVLALFLAFVATAGALAAESERLVYETDSLYHHIIVSETATTRILRFRKGPTEKALGSSFAQSLISLEDPYSLAMGYSRYSIAAAALVENPKRVLFVGLGAGSMPKFFARAFPNCRVDVAEIDAKVLDVAKRFFFFPDLPRLHVTIEDGRVFLRRQKEKYDIIFLDAYRDHLIPFHLLTQDFFEELKTRLTPGGLLVANVAVKNSAQLYPWMLRTYQASFGTLLEARVPNTLNKVLVGFDAVDAVAPGSFEKRALAFERDKTPGFDAAECARGFKDVSSEKKTRRVLTDDYAPVNLMWRRKADEKDWEY